MGFTSQLYPGEVVHGDDTPTMAIAGPFGAMIAQLERLLTRWREPGPRPHLLPGITEIFLAALGPNGDRGFQCEIGFGDCTTQAFAATSLPLAVEAAHGWAMQTYEE